MIVRREWIDATEPLSVAAQCRLLNVPRSSWYYRAKEPNDFAEMLMNRLDRLYMEMPFYGVRRMTEALNREGIMVGHDRVRHLLRQMGLMAIYPKPRLSAPGVTEQRYPYLLKGLNIIKSNQVWSTDITYIPMRRGHLYLTAIMDWYSRYVVAWELADTMEVEHSIAALDRALEIAQPDIFNSDQGAQFTSHSFVERLESRKIRVSWDGRRRYLDNIFIERLWRSVKYEEVYLKAYDSPKEARTSIRAYFNFYNDRRPHQSLDYRTPKEVYGH